MSYQFKRISKSYLPFISNLYKECFGIEISAEALIPKYDTDIFGESYVGFVAIDENNSVGAYYGAFTCQIRSNGSIFLACQSGDTMTGVNHRKKGLFTSLAKETYSLAESLEMACVFGFPNENSLPGFRKKLNWNFYGEMQRFTISNNVLLPICEIASKYQRFKGAYRALISTRLKKYIVREININGLANGVNRDDAFFKYKRKKSKDIYLLKIEGFEFIIKTEPHLMIGDVAMFDRNRLDDFKRILTKLAKLTYANKTNLVMSKNHWLYNLLVNDYQCEKSLPIGFYEIERSIDYSELAFSLVDYDTF